MCAQDQKDLEFCRLVPWTLTLSTVHQLRSTQMVSYVSVDQASENNTTLKHRSMLKKKVCINLSNALCRFYADDTVISCSSSSVVQTIEFLLPAIVFCLVPVNPT